MRRIGCIGGLILGLTACSGPATGPVVSDGSSSVVADAARAVEDRWQPETPLSFAVSVELEDAKGNPSSDAALQFDWTGSTMTGINADNIDRYQLVDLANVTILSARGVIALAEWCDDNGRALTPRLCGQERARAEEAWALKVYS